MRRRRSVSLLGMSFLDVMFCGFGSVILLVMLMHGETVRQREPVLVIGEVVSVFVFSRNIALMRRSAQRAAAGATS